MSSEAKEPKYCSECGNLLLHSRFGRYCTNNCEGTNAAKQPQPMSIEAKEQLTAEEQARQIVRSLTRDDFGRTDNDEMIEEIAAAINTALTTGATQMRGRCLEVAQAKILPYDPQGTSWKDGFDAGYARSAVKIAEAITALPLTPPESREEAQKPPRS